MISLPTIEKKMSPQTKAKQIVETYQRKCKNRGIFILTKPYPKIYWKLYHYLVKFIFNSDNKDITFETVLSKVTFFTNTERLKGDYFELLHYLEQEFPK